MRVLVTLIAVVAAISIASHQPVKANPSQSPQQPVFRAATDYVRVDVVVTDSSDRPIRDLTKDDFEVVEKGRAQEIRDFQFIDVPLPPRPTSAAPPSGPPPDVANNVAPSPKSRVFVVVIDDLHLLEQDIVAIKKLLNDFVDALAPDDEVAMVFVSFSNLSLNFTTDRGVIRRRIDKVRESLGFSVDALGRTVLAADARTPMRYVQSADAVLKNVAQSLAGSGHSRRAIVFVTNGSSITTAPDPFVPNDYDDIQLAYRAAERANVPIYTIDPRGQVLAEDAVRGGIGIIDAPTGSGPSRTAISAAVRRQADRLAEIAIATGGRAFTGQSDLTKAVRELVADNGSYYLLGYYPAPFAADGKYHDLDVKVKRPGTRVRARQGYVASSIGPATDSPQPLLNAAISSGVNVTGIELRAFAAPLAAGEKGVKTAVTLEVTYPPLLEGVRTITDDLQMSIVALDADAKTKATSERAMHFSGAVPDRNAIVFSINDVIELPSQPLTVRVGLASRMLGRAGSVQFSLDVPKPADDKLQLSGVVVGRVGDQSPAMNAALIAPLIPFQPTTSRTFARTDTLRVFGRAFWKSKDGATVNVGVQGAAAAQTKLTTATGTRGGQEATFDATLPLSGVTPGNHVIEIVVTLSGKSISREIPITIR